MRSGTGGGLLENERVEGSEASSGNTANGAESDTNVETDGASRAAELEQPSEWKDFDYEKQVTPELSQETWASLWAAYIVRHDDTRQEEYDVLRKCVESVLKKEHLFGEVILDTDNLESSELVELVVDGMWEDDIVVTIGIRVKVQQFVSAIRRNV